MTPEEQNERIRRAVKALEGMPDGAETTTWELAGADIPPEDMFPLHFSIIKEVSREGMTFDFSKYEDIVVGMPYELPFILHKGSK